MSTAIARLTAALADRYRIERELGQGGMATVYLAEDLKHKRKIALKVLKPELAAVLGGERFVQEIATTAALQHPHILPLFDSGSVYGPDKSGPYMYYVMPFIDGETLRARLDRETQLGVEEAVRIASDVASALHYAHQHGVIHRDIKPENILLHDGRPMVADFGIALAVSAAAGGRMTETGLSLGTPHYMSPEQATAAKEITARSDVYSLASVLYEMLTGDPPHTGASAQQIIMKIVTEEAAPVTSLRKSVPPHVAAAVAQALAKLPADRFSSAAEFAQALQNPGFRSDGAAAWSTTHGPGSNVAWKWLAAGLGLTVICLGALAAWALWRTNATPREVGLLPTAPMEMRGQFRNFAVAHDGSFVVYLARVGEVTQLWYRSLRGADSYPIAGTEGAGGTPRISPDGTQVAFQVASELRVATLGGGPVTLLAQVQDPQGGEWLSEGTLFFGDRDGRMLRWIDIATGATRERESIYCLHPQLIAGDRVLCGGGAQKYAAVIHLDRPLEKLPMRQSGPTADGGGSIVLGSHFRLIDEHYLVYVSLDGALMGARIGSLDSLTVGRSVVLTPQVRRNAYSGVGQYEIADDGALVYVPGINADVGRLVQVRRDGRLEPLALEEAAFLRYTPSPGGRWLAAVVEGTQHQELRVYDLEDGTSETRDRGFFIGAPAWSPDGNALVYIRNDNPVSEHLLLLELDSPGGPRVLVSFQPTVGGQVSAYLTPNLILIGTASKEAGTLLVDPTVSPAKVDSLALNSFFGSISPDRRWIAYQIAGGTGVHLQPWPAMNRRYLVDAEGNEPRWGSAGELVYLSQYWSAGMTGAAFHRVSIEPGSTSPIGRREVIIRDPRFNDTPGWSHALTNTGELIYLQSPSENLGYYVRIIPDWVAQVKRAIDEANR